jgi:lipopolysaccharide export LptBFGC system permease protein LptF
MGGHARGRSALGLTLAAIILTGDLFWIVLFQATHYSGWSTEFGTIPAPLVLLALGIFCLWIYLRSDNTASLSGQMKAES